MLSLFSGIGGIDLAASWAGVETVAFCEIEPFCQKVLQKHWPDVPIFDDVRTITKQALAERGVTQDVSNGTIDIVAGGYPCQPFSLAGKRQGEHDDRHLWPEMFRIIQELRPTWVVGENVAGHISMGLDDVLSDLESEGYQARAFVLPAASVGAPHKRERVFIVAHSGSTRLQGSEQEALQGFARLPLQSPRGAKEWSRGWDLSKPRLLGVGNGVSSRIHRTKALGNAVVPAQIYPIFKAIVEASQ